MALADTALNQRAALFEQRKNVANDGSLSNADKRSRIESIDRQMDDLEAEARGHVKAAESELRIKELNAEAARMVAGTNRNSRNSMEWRSIVPTENEWRALVAEGSPAAGGYAVPTKVASEWIDKLRNQSVFMQAPGLRVIPFDGAKFVIPQLTASTDPAVVGEGNAIPEGSLTFAGPSLTPVKYAALYRASSEVIEDASVDVEALVGDTLVRDIGQVVDKDAFSGAGSATALLGLTAAGNSAVTTLSTGKTTVTWADVIAAYGRIAATGSTPTVIWASVDMWTALVSERENGATGAFLAQSVTADPARAAMGLPLLVSNNVPARTVIVADASRIFCGIRRDIRLAKSDQWKFDSDTIGYRATYRIAGSFAAEATSVQRIVAAAS
ncbi:phage major capsid protein [Actinoplanes sp. NPDC048988]|uniref:phage major capsid protein n=1 Tax=Actinoplanes sp. NPDC048988 TaxID=3363901 RepID=UPI00371A4CB8